MDSLLQKYKDKKPQIVFEWNDPETDAEGWVVINSLRGGAAGGGTRMRLGLDRGEVESLAKVMEIKFTVSGPSIGGAKSGINFDPNDPRKNEVLERWFAAVIPILKNYYGTGGDLNVDEVKDVIPITEDYGLWHPQEGVVNGHFGTNEAQKIHRIGQLRQGVSKKVEDPKYTPDLNQNFVIADLITGWGVSESVKHYYKIWKNESLKDKKVVVQGWGNVAGTAGYYLAKNGAKIIGIIDKDGGLINEKGYSFDEITTLLKERDGNKLYASNMLSFEEVNDKIWDLSCDIFIPAAASKLVTHNQIKRLIDKGCSVVSSGANVPFKDADIFFGDTAKFADDNLALIPDFIANCGMARTFAYLMEEKIEISDEAIFNDVSNCIEKALKEVNKINNNDKNIAKAALQIAIKKLI
ncbi:MAG: amino acid dehydrogenase [Chitinophagales bacterium]|nr:amino acid dehydrogenase [Chitinophagales bacterium]